MKGVNKEVIHLCERLFFIKDTESLLNNITIIQKFIL